MRLPKECDLEWYYKDNKKINYRNKEVIATIEKAFERDNTGRRILDYLMCNIYSKELRDSVHIQIARESVSGDVDSDAKVQYNSFMKNKWSEDLLKKRAVKIIQKSEREQAYGVIDAETLLQEDIRPILKNNYIVLANNESWVVFKVNITDDIINQIYINPNWYCSDDIKVDVKFVEKGKMKRAIKKGSMYDKENVELVSSLVEPIGEKIPIFAIQNQIIGLFPVTMYYDNRQGLEKGDRMSIYRAVEKGGKIKSQRIGRARIAKIGYNNSSATLSMIAGWNPSYKRGDVAVLDRDKKYFTGLSMGYQMGDGFNLNWTGEMLCKFTGAGFSNYFVHGISFATYTDWLKVDEINHTLDAWGYSGKLGYGLGKTFFNNLEIMPYITFQFELASLLGYINESEKELLEENYNMNMLSLNFKMPVGLRANLNVYYPVQLMFGVEYSLPLFAFSFKGHKVTEFKKTEEETEEIIVADNVWSTNKHLFNVYGGIRIAF